MIVLFRQSRRTVGTPPLMRSGRRGVVLLLLACALAPLLASKSVKPPEKLTLTPEQIVKKWADGPVRYLMTYDEQSKLLELKKPEDLARFITNFWAKRDPSPGTFENEYRRMFWTRVFDANRRFRSSTTPGWKTDRGKIYILLGEPDNIESNMAGRSTLPGPTGAVSGSFERWTYKRQFSKVTAPEYYVVFTIHADEWTLSSDPNVTSPFYDFQGLVVDSSVGGPAAVQQAIAALDAVQVTSIQANIDLGNELQVASNPELILATVNTRDFVSAFSAATKFEFFRAKDGSTFVNVCGLLNAADLYAGAAKGISRQRLYASLEPVAPGGTTRYASNEKTPNVYDLSKGPEPGGIIGVWSGVAVTPGRYRVTMALEDSFTGRLGRATAEIEVPDYSGAALALSTPVLASSLGEASDRMNVVARSSGVFRKSEEFGVYYEVYGIAAVAAGAGGSAAEGGTAAPAFDASYLFFRETPQGPQPIGHPLDFKDRSGASQGWSFPLAKWPAGKFRLQITVTDRLGKSASATVPFEVQE